MLRLHKDDYVPKYRSGKWAWDGQTESIRFQSFTDLAHANETFMRTNGFKFRKTLNQVEELAFRQEYMRPYASSDGDIILVQDIRNLVLFLMPQSFIGQDFILFVFSKPVERFWHALIIYFEYFLKMVEFVLIRRDEVCGDTNAQIQSTQSTEIKKVFSMHLAQYRLLLAREYSIILLGKGEMQRFYHMKPIVNISMTIRDKHFHEQFLAVSTQIVWIAMHRRAYDVINMEMSRLFRSEHFKLTQHERLQYTTAEAAMLFGKNYVRVNYRAQNSPLIQELMYVSDENLPILWIAERKYRGTDKRIAALELEYVVPDSQLSLIDITHGILGHPKKLYNTLLKLDWGAMRNENYTEDNDPYRIIRQPRLPIPNISDEKLRTFAQEYQSYYQVVLHFSPINRRTLLKWLNRKTIFAIIAKDNLITNVYMRAQSVVADEVLTQPIDKILSRFRTSKLDLRKHSSTRNTLMSSELLDIRSRRSVKSFVKV